MGTQGQGLTTLVFTAVFCVHGFIVRLFNRCGIHVAQPCIITEYLCGPGKEQSVGCVRLGEKLSKLAIRSVEHGICPIVDVCKVRRHHRAPQQQFPGKRRNFADSAVNYGGFILHIFHCACSKWLHFIAGVKSDVTIEFLDPNFPYDAEISAIRP